MEEEIKNQISADIKRHIRHCAMRYNVKQDEVLDIIKEMLDT